MNNVDNQQLIETLKSQENIDINEGSQGVKNLCCFVNLMGYKDSMHFGQFLRGKHNACYGDLIHFLEDNSGAVEAIYQWIESTLEDEQKENLISNLNTENYSFLCEEEEEESE